MKNHLDYFFLKSLFIGIILRIIYLLNKTGEFARINLGGDPCHHFNIAYNISKLNGPKTDFIFSFWHRHEVLPALTDIYPPGFHLFSAFFIFFYDEFLITRIIPFIIFLLNIYFTILIGKRLKRHDLGVLTSFLILINFYHIENSVVFMTVTFYMLLTQIFFYLFIVFDQNKKFIFFLGLSAGYASISFGGWQIFILIMLFYFFKKKHKIIKDYLLFIVGFLFFAIPWGLYTYNYFGSIYYSNLNFYPIIQNWSEMTVSTTKPNLINFINNTDLIEFAKNHFFWFLDHLKTFSLRLFPTFLFPLSFLLIPLIILGAIKLKRYGFYFLIFIFLYLILISLSSYALSGNLFTRHFIPLLFLTSILLSNGIIFIYKKYFFKKLFIENKYQNFSLIIIFIITISGILLKDSFWNKNTTPFFQFGKEIQKIVPVNSKIMYELTPQDLWCVSNRQVIIDPNVKNRTREEIYFYKPDYLLLDFSKHIYNRSNNDLNNTSKKYYKFNLSLELSDEINGYYLYKINY